MGNPLLELPPELLAHIMHYIDRDHELEESDDGDQDRLQHLLAVSQTCRQLHAAVEPFLYRKYVSGDGTSVWPFLRSLCENPRLAGNVRVVCIESSDMQNIRPSPVELELFRAAMDTFLDWDLHDVLLFALSRGCHAAKVVLISLLTTKIQQLGLDPVVRSSCCCPQVAESLTSFLAWSGSTGREVYNDIQVFAVEPTYGDEDDDEDDYFPFELVTQFMQLPSLKRLQVEGQIMPSHPQPTYSRISNVSHLTLEGHRANDNISACAMINSCKSLEVLEISDYGDIPSINDCLARHMSSLEELTITPCNDLSVQICDLEDFTRLAHLSIDSMLFSGNSTLDDLEAMHFPTLPTSLRQLWIRTDGGLDDLFAILNHALPRLPSELEELSFDCAISGSGNEFYLDSIRELHMHNGKSYTPDDIRTKDNTDWIIFLHEVGGGMEFLCRKGKQSVSKTLSALLKDISISGISPLLSNYYKDWPSYDPDKESALAKVKHKAYDNISP